MSSNADIHQEQLLWTTFAGGNNLSLKAIYDLYYDSLYNYGLKCCANAALAEDAIQDLFLKLMRNRSSLGTPVSVKHYLLRAYRNLLLDKIDARKKHIHTLPLEEHFLGLEPAIDLEMAVNEQRQRQLDQLRQAIQRLTPRQREAIYLRFHEGLSYQEVARLMELSPKATYKLMARAIDALKESCLAWMPLSFLLRNLGSPDAKIFFSEWVG